MDFTDRKREQHKHILATAHADCKIVEIDVMDKEQVSPTFDHNDLTFDHKALTFDHNALAFDFGNIVIEFEDIDEDFYINEKRRGGENSYKNYKPLKEKTEELCRQELESQTYKTAKQLCHVVAGIIERDYKELLENFIPHTREAKLGKDWTKDTFYNWCKSIFKSMKATSNIQR